MLTEHSVSTDMRKHILNILLFLLGGLLNTNGQDCKSILEIETNKDSALIFINDRLEGYGKVRREVTLGKYYFTIKENLERWNEHEINDSVNIKLCDKEYLISFNLFDKYYVDTSPQDAAVFIYDSLMAYTPNFISVNQFHTIMLKKKGYTKPVHSSELSLYNRIPLELPEQKKDESFSDSQLFKILLGTAAVLGAASAYFKIKADNGYEGFLQSKDPAKLKEVDRLDLYSGITFGLLQVNFGYLIYRFLFD